MTHLMEQGHSNLLHVIVYYSLGYCFLGRMPVWIDIDVKEQMLYFFVMVTSSTAIMICEFIVPPDPSIQSKSIVKERTVIRSIHSL